MRLPGMQPGIFPEEACGLIAGSEDENGRLLKKFIT